jgi:tRNA A37 threonylcarbamoyladenosine dehydratase
MSPSVDRFSGVARVFGAEGMARLIKARVLVVGVGGVGSWSVEALARSGVGTIVMVDLDDICATNTNRQIHALDSNFGRLKVDALADRVRAINPECVVRAIPKFFTASTAEEILAPAYDWVIDAIDSAPQKSHLIAAAVTAGSRVVTVGGVGGLRESSGFKVVDLNRSVNDKLLFLTRKRLRQTHSWKRGRAKWGVPAVFSEEFPTEPPCDAESAGTNPMRMGCEVGYGALTYVTGVAGFIAAGVVIEALAAGD